MRTAAPIVMLVGAVTLLGASAIHAGIFGPVDPFAAAALPEAVLGAVLGIAAVVAFLRPTSRTVALGATAFALLGTVYGLTVTVPRGEAGAIGYHVGLLSLLLVATALLVRSPRYD